MTRKLRQKKSRGRAAARLREEPLVAEFFAKIEAAIVKVWRTSLPGERDLRETAYYRLQALDDLSACFTQTIADGKNAEAELLRLMNAKQKDAKT